MILVLSCSMKNLDIGAFAYHIQLCLKRLPLVVTSAKKLCTTRYSSWWERSYGMFLEDILDVMLEKAGLEFVSLLEEKNSDIKKTLSKVKTPFAPQHQCMKLEYSKASKKEVVHTSTNKYKRPQFLFSNRRALQ